VPEDEVIDEVGPLISDVKVRADLDITEMTGWRWDRDPRMAALGWPPAIYRGRYKFRSLPAYRRFKANLLRQALDRRSVLFKHLPVTLPVTLPGINTTDDDQ
jgi:hypothetical protein